MKVAIVGYGKMGHAVERILLSRGHEVVLRVDVGLDSLDDASDVDVAIEFSAPSAAYDNIVTCLRKGIPVVSGTTAWLSKLDEVKELCRELGGAFFYSSNYSIGVNVFLKANKCLAKLMDRFGDFDVTIEETHHSEKKDAPSGTAVTIAEGIVGEVSRKSGWTLGIPELEDRIGIASIRRSRVKGIHSVVWESEEECIELNHTAHSRDCFARGAVMAAEFLVGRTGVFGMDDLLEL